MAFVNVSVNNKDTFLIRLAWTENTAEILVFNFEDLKLWKGEATEEANLKFAAGLQLNIADYKAQLSESLKPSSSCQLILSENTLTIKKLTSEDVSFRIAAIPLKELELLSSLPGFMTIIAKNLNEFSSGLDSKDARIEELTEQNGMLMERCVKYVKIVEDLTPSLYTQFCEAFNEQKERLHALLPEKPAGEEKETRTGTTAINELDKPSTSTLHDEEFENDTDVDTEEEEEASNSP